jgi:hypothetical protein
MGRRLTVPRFNRERRLIELLRKGHAVLLFRSWDTPGVLAAGRAHAEALEHPARMEWDPRLREAPESIEGI